MTILNAILKQYQGFVATPNLWDSDTLLYGIEQFTCKPLPRSKSIDTSNLPSRLGKRVEHFVCHDLKQHPALSLIAHNLQIQQHKQTIGEIDVLLVAAGKPIHLEIVYKFYLYDSTVGTTELAHWIGPNRKDSLIQKLDKLKDKQFPLLYHSETAKYLETYGLHADTMQQKVLFKAQLFVPVDLENKTFSTINPDCIAGYYYKKDQLTSLQTCQFYLPSKLNWLVAAHQDITWLSYKTFVLQIEALLDSNLAPLIWIKHPSGTLERSFLVWW